MKKIFQSIGLLAIVLFSFYYTERAARLVQERSPIMQTIKEISSYEKMEYQNAVINDDTIIPGLCGKTVDNEKSFLKMQELGIFNEYYLVYSETKPKISMEDNKDKIIVAGNKSKKAVAIIVDNNIDVKNYLETNDIKGNYLATHDNSTTNLEMLNNESDLKLFNAFDKELSRSNANVNICIVSDTNKEFCLKNKKYLVKPGVTLEAGNIVDVKNKIESGAIIMIKPSATLADFNLLLKQIEYKGLKILPLSELISEKN